VDFGLLIMVGATVKDEKNLGKEDELATLLDTIDHNVKIMRSGAPFTKSAEATGVEVGLTTSNLNL
jgi:hypothetical protein